MPAAMYAPHIPHTRHNGVAMGMVAGTTMAMSAGEPHFLYFVKKLDLLGLLALCSVLNLVFVLVSSGTLLTTPSPAPVAPHQVTMPTYRPPGTPSYSYVPTQW